MTRSWITVTTIAAVLGLAGCGQDKPAQPSADAAKAKAAAEAAAKEKEAITAGVEAVVYGLPLVIMDITQDKTTNVAKAGGFAAPVNQFVHVTRVSRTRRSRMSSARTSTRSTRRRGSTCRRSRWCCRCPTPRAATT